jgi:sortase A
MDTDKGISSTELERLLLRRRRQEAVRGLRQLSPLQLEEAAPDAATIPSDGLAQPAASSPEGQVVVAKAAAPPSATPVFGSGEGGQPRPLAQLRPVNLKPRSKPRVARRWLGGLKKALGRVVDLLVLVLLILIILALGFWLYDQYLAPMLRRSNGTTAQVQESSPLLLIQSRLSPPEEAVAQAPLPFEPYSTTVTPEPLPYVPVPTPAPGTVLPTRLVIPRIEVDTPVVEVTVENGVWQVADYAAGYHRGTARPGTVGNTVISGHKGLRGGVFYRLDELSVGDEVYLYAGPRLYLYTIEQKISVWPQQVEVMAQTSSPILTLITCTAYDTKRLIVVARLDGEVPTLEGSAP